MGCKHSRQRLIPQYDEPVREFSSIEINNIPVRTRRRSRRKSEIHSPEHEDTCVVTSDFVDPYNCTYGFLNGLYTTK